MDSAVCVYIFMNLYTYVTIIIKAKNFCLRETEVRTWEEVGEGIMGGIREKGREGKGKLVYLYFNYCFYLKKKQPFFFQYLFMKNFKNQNKIFSSVLPTAISLHTANY